jgi:uracil-DNA glycosylase family 4
MSPVAIAEDVDRFVRLCADAAACDCCPAMAGRRRVLGTSNGDPGAARVLFIGEAPGRHGGERTGVPFSGDQSGRNFEALLAVAGLTRAEVFVTNAVLCNPRDPVGRNRGPSRQELANCSTFLARQLDFIAAPVVVTLGAVALRAAGDLTAHGLQLRDSVGRVTPWRGRLLVPLYHPGSRARVHRDLAQQCADFSALGGFVNALDTGTFRVGDTF